MQKDSLVKEEVKSVLVTIGAATVSSDPSIFDPSNFIMPVILVLFLSLHITSTNASSLHVLSSLISWFIPGFQCRGGTCSCFEQDAACEGNSDCCGGE